MSALSPIDLIPDFIPVLGKRGERPVSRVGAAVIIGIWIVAVLATVYWLAGFVRS